MQCIAGIEMVCSVDRSSSTTYATYTHLDAHRLNMTNVGDHETETIIYKASNLIYTYS